MGVTATLAWACWLAALATLQGTPSVAFRVLEKTRPPASDAERHTEGVPYRIGA
jgi:hypothetical protein